MSTSIKYITADEAVKVSTLMSQGCGSQSRRLILGADIDRSRTHVRRGSIFPGPGRLFLQLTGT